MPSEAKACSLGRALQDLCRDYRTVTVIASEQELKQLGLDLGQAITLEEFQKKLQETEKTQSTVHEQETKPFPRPQSPRETTVPATEERGTEGRTAACGKSTGSSRARRQ